MSRLAERARGAWLLAPWRDPALRRPLLGWLGVGLAVRLAIAPFTISADLLAVYWRSHLIAYDGTVFGSYLVNMGAHYTHAVSLRLLDPVLPAADVLWTDPWWWSDSGGLAAQIQREFVATDGIFTTLLALKLPYLAFDLAAGLLLVAAVRGVVRRGAVAGLVTGDARRVVAAWAFWMLSPVGLYASYAFGRYEMFAVALVLAALVACERDHVWWAAVLLGLAITMRGYPIILVPIFGLIAVRRPLERAAWAALSLLPLGVVLYTNTLWADTVGEFARLRDFATGSTFLAYTLPVDGPGPIYVFVLFALAVYVGLIGRAYGWWGDGPVPVAELWVWLALFHGGLFALTTFSAHYFAWITPFVALAIARRPAWRGQLWLHLLAVGVVLLAADLAGGPGVTWGLFQPLAPGLAESVPSLREVLLLDPDTAEQLAGLLRSTTIVLLVAWAWPALAEVRRGWAGDVDPATVGGAETSDS